MFLDFCVTLYNNDNIHIKKHLFIEQVFKKSWLTGIVTFPGQIVITGKGPSFVGTKDNFVP